MEDDEGDAVLVCDELADTLPRAHVSRSRTLAQALDDLQAQPDCVLLDLGLPDTSGLDAVGALRSRAATIPLIVLTGLADEAAGVAAVEAGAQDYLVKGSVHGGQLARSIRYAIGRRQADEAERELLVADAQAREVARLERGLAPAPLLDDASLSIASRYRAGRSRALLGGDFFDAVQLSDGTLHALVGDVCGNGPDEAAVGVGLRAAWRALALTAVPAESSVRTLQLLFEQERHVPELFATLCTLRIALARREVSMIRAGHPRPMLIAGETVRALSDDLGNTVLGVGEHDWRSERVALPERWAILLYTDGIVEGRVGAGSERLGEAGLRRLIERHVAAYPDWREHPHALLDALLGEAERLNGGPLSDDVAMLLVGTRAASERP